MVAEGRLAESASELRQDRNGRTMDASGIAGSNRGRRLSKEESDASRADPDRTCHEGPDDVGMNKSTGNPNRRNIFNPDPDYARRIQVRALTKAWEDADNAAREEFGEWLREHRPEWFGPPRSPIAAPRRRDRSAPDRPRGSQFAGGSSKAPGGGVELGHPQHQAQRTRARLIVRLVRPGSSQHRRRNSGSAWRDSLAHPERRLSDPWRFPT